MKKKFKILAVIPFFTTLTNCSSAFFTLSPDEESSLEYGRNKIEKEDQLVYSSIMFEEQAEDDFIFYVTVYNKDQHEFIFDPSDIYYKVYDEKKRPIYREKNYAVDPEIQIEQLEKDIIERKEDHYASTGLNIVFSLFDTNVDLTDDEDNDTEEVLKNVAVFSGNQLNEEFSYDNDMGNLKANKEFWKNEVLRKTSLSENEGVEGTIYIPIFNNAKYIKLFIPIGASIHSYKFMQIEHLTS